jgi:threonine/homoserine/homoserine lactone efflux protein
MARGRLAADAQPYVAGKSARPAFFERISVKVLNPTAALFFLAFLPQFVDPTAALPLSAQFLALGTAVNLTVSSADGVAILLTSAVLRGARRTGLAERIARLVGGSLLAGLGARMVFARD